MAARPGPASPPPTRRDPRRRSAASAPSRLRRSSKERQWTSCVTRARSCSMLPRRGTLGRGRCDRRCWRLCRLMPTSMGKASATASVATATSPTTRGSVSGLPSAPSIFAASASVLASSTADRVTGAATRLASDSGSDPSCRMASSSSSVPSDRSDPAMSMARARATAVAIAAIASSLATGERRSRDRRSIATRVPPTRATTRARRPAPSRSSRVNQGARGSPTETAATRPFHATAMRLAARAPGLPRRTTIVTPSRRNRAACQVALPVPGGAPPKTASNATSPAGAGDSTNPTRSEMTSGGASVASAGPPNVRQASAASAPARDRRRLAWGRCVGCGIPNRQGSLSPNDGDPSRRRMFAGIGRTAKDVRSVAWSGRFVREWEALRFRTPVVFATADAKLATVPPLGRRGFGAAEISTGRGRG